MMDSIKHYSLFANLFDYPGDDFKEKVEEVQAFLDKKYPEVGKLLSPFTDYMTKATLIKQQELFIRSFDVQAVTTLDLGYVMFGDDYKRGEMLVNLNREHREVENDCGVELSDHMPNVLRLLPKMKDTPIVEELVKKIIAPSLRRMIRGFEPEQIELKDKFYKRKHKTIIDRPDEHYTIYQKTLEALLWVLKLDFDFEEKELKEKTSDFLRNIVTEAKLEG
jgi:nitrate reductase assembly molybdenum cofactor insertion protein NarJ